MYKFRKTLHKPKRFIFPSSMNFVELLDIPTEAVHHKSPIDPKYGKTYGRRKTIWVQIIYLLSILVWGGLIWGLRMYQTDFIGWIIILVPFAIFFICYYNACNHTREMEADVLQTNSLSVGLVVVLPLMMWINSSYNGHPEKKRDFMALITVALIIALLSLVDIWVKPKWFTPIKHIKSIFQTYSIFLFVFALYFFYLASLVHLAEYSS